MKSALYLLSLLYSFGMQLRNWSYENKLLRSYKACLPVISVGNISAGGTGKTPLCIFLVGLLRDMNRKPVVLSRGYGGSYRGLHLVGAGDNAALCGDEPILIQKKTACPVVLCADRVAGIRYIEKEALGDVVILDDGFQHRRLKRDLDIVVLNVGTAEAVEDLKQNRVIPYGRLRESVAAALRRAGLIVLSSRTSKNAAPAVSQNILSLLPHGVPALRSFFELGRLVSLDEKNILESGSEIAVFCGIANPQSFLDSLKAAGYRTKGSMLRPDHYKFTAADLAAFSESFPGLPLVCTEKDATRVEDFAGNHIYKAVGELLIEPEEILRQGISAALKGIQH